MEGREAVWEEQLRKEIERKKICEEIERNRINISKIKRKLNDLKR